MIMNYEMEIVYFLWRRGGDTQAGWMYHYFLRGFYGLAFDRLKRKGWIRYCAESVHYYLSIDVMNRLKGYREQ